MIWVAVFHVWFAGVPISLDRVVEDTPFRSQAECVYTARLAAQEIMRRDPSVRSVDYGCLPRRAA